MELIIIILFIGFSITLSITTITSNRTKYIKHLQKDLQQIEIINSREVFKGSARIGRFGMVKNDTVYTCKLIYAHRKEIVEIPNKFFRKYNFNRFV